LSVGIPNGSCPPQRKVCHQTTEKRHQSSMVLPISTCAMEKKDARVLTTGEEGVVGEHPRCKAAGCYCQGLEGGGGQFRFHTSLAS
jgi:hypothetical protein